MFYRKQSNYHQKRQKRHDELRRQSMNQIFSDKRKHLEKQRLFEQSKISSRQKLRLLLEELEKNQQLSKDSLLLQIHKELKNQNQDIKELIRIYGKKLLNIWISMPKNLTAIQMYLIFLKQLDHYNLLFKPDDQQFTILYKEIWLNIAIPQHQITQCQLSIYVLFETINTEIYLFNNLQLTPEPMSLQQYGQIKESNSSIEKRLKLYFYCLGCLCNTSNLFIYREEFLKYARNWLKYLVLQKNWRNQEFFTYIMMLSVYHIPIEAMSRKGFESKMSENFQDKQQIESDQKLIQQLFNWGITNNAQALTNQNRIPMICMTILKLLFENEQTPVYYILKYSNNILHYTMTILNYQTYFKQSKIIHQYDLIGNILERLKKEYRQQNQSLQFYQQLRYTTIYNQMKEINFFSTLSVVLKNSSNNIKIAIYRLIRKLIEYCIQYDLLLIKLFHQNDLFILTVKGIEENRSDIILESLNCISNICYYADNVSKDDQYFINMIDLSVDQVIQNLTHNQDPNISSKSQYILNNYFNKDRLYRYTLLQVECFRYQSNTDIQSETNRKNLSKNMIQVPSRNETYNFDSNYK